jgi:hypothetical protein
MKQTISAFLSLCGLSGLLFAGPEELPAKDKDILRPAGPIVEIYRAHEVEVDVWGTYVFSANPGTNHVGDVDPFRPDTDPFVFDVGTGFFGEPQSQNPNEKINLGQQSKDAFLGKDDAFGGGVDVKVFVTKYVGVGLEGFDVDARENGAAALGTLTFRYPMGRFAPYAWGGCGGLLGGGATYHFFNEKHTFVNGFVSRTPPNFGEQQFWTDQVVPNNHVRFLGQLGGGLQFRFTPHIGLMADFAWNFVAGNQKSDSSATVNESGQDLITFFGMPISRTPANNSAIKVIPRQGSDNQNFGMVRTGLTFAF